MNQDSHCKAFYKKKYKLFQTLYFGYDTFNLASMVFLKIKTLEQM